MMRHPKTAFMAASALLCAVLWPMPMYAQQSTGARAATPAAPVAHAPRATPQGFSVVLVVGDLQVSGGEDDVPPAARRALADMKDFLPYKSYKLVDAAWIVGTTHTVSRLRGPEGRDYELEITTSDPRMTRMIGGQSPAAAASGDARVGVSFSLRDAGSAGGSGGGSGSANASGNTSGSSASSLALLQQQLQEVEAQYQEARNKLSSTHPEVVKLEAQMQGLRQKTIEAERQVEHRAIAQGRSSRAVINTSFTMDVGETVVVGTSRLSGNSKALIALLTAVPQKTTKR